MQWHEKNLIRVVGWIHIAHLELLRQFRSAFGRTWTPPRSTQQPLLPDWTSGRGAGGSWGRVGGQWEANLGTGPPGTTLTGVGEGGTSWQRRRQLRARALHARAQPLEQKNTITFLKLQ